ncbi:MAG: isoleucine--tRNA ligase [Candidatus Nitrohelix vancouverensis]|uniref:Isoleucine--tRNA ligase n=1 Tax=Candidatus Nitrohelix vancouverensis TaxID=2705534 RepID=A0A7T0G3P4_9BACT|nr:MAG: isoleucine--tRNA ligase [Candidatus Nitrohelix vancouverensis]
MDYKETLNLPKTDFPMKANLLKKEPEMLARWEEENLYGEIRRHFAGKPKFTFHDGPPYANGHIHMGHALNKILKDFIVKIKTMHGFDAGFIPGWDCHGLPIEHQVTKEERKKKNTPDKAEIRKLCREYAAGFVDIQREEFKRLAVFADWERPYLTMNFSYQASIVRELGKVAEQDILYKGLKPVHWCMSCKTALAEAEVEHADHKSTTVYVKFPVASELPASLNASSPASVVIWTTTPWTLPANMAICLHPDFQYAAVELNGECIIVAEDMAPALAKEWGVEELPVLGRCAGKELEHVICQHPFYNRESTVILGDHVTLEQGTGCVHTAPGHGQEDYVVGMKYGLETYNPVDDAGVFVEDLPLFGGMFVMKANAEIVSKLEAEGKLIYQSEIKHSYPHCWRCHQPIIFRATRQWFISMDKEGLRSKALSAINEAEWIPHWGRERIYGMVENRPDWCVSRQRAWGAPIAIVSCLDCGEMLKTKEIFAHIVALIEKHGADYWFEKDVKELVPEGTVCACGSSNLGKEQDILDVWFDSGTSHAAVLEADPEQSWPADLYLEGSDQHRGWFHSSLLESIATRGKAPYRAVLTHGYVVDGKGKKMSKSAGNVIAPQKIIDQYGAEVLRLWVASENYREDIRISQEILKRLTEAYRKIRNTFRFLLGNLSDFDPKKDAVALDELMEIDRYILFRFNGLKQKILGAYDRYEFHTFYHAFYNFCIVDLSAFYLDIVKDRLYTFAPGSKGRRSCQTALHYLLQDMARLMAPVLSFMAEEVWDYLPEGSAPEKSVHLSSFPEDRAIEFDDALREKWESLIELKGEVSRALEICRQEKVIGHSLDAHVKLALPEALLKRLQEDVDELKFIFIVSKVDIVTDLSQEEKVYQSESMKGVGVFVQSVGGQKCERCWNYFDSDGAKDALLCERCVENLEIAQGAE